MKKLSTALIGLIGVAGLAIGTEANAGVSVGVDIGLPGIAIAPPVVGYGPRVYAPYYYPPYYYGGHYWHGPYAHYGYRGYWHGRYWR